MPPSTTATVQPSVIDNTFDVVSSKSHSQFPAVLTFTSKLEEREYLKFRLAQAFRIFGKLA